MGRLTIDKANSNFSCFVYPLVSLKSHGGKMSRADFVSDVAAFCQIPAEKSDGTENRTAYNKANFTRYYGLIDLSYEAGEEMELLTRRGELFLQCVEENPSYSSHKDRYRVVAGRKSMALDLIIDSLLFDSFGCFNLGAKRSESSVEPPKVLFRMLCELGDVSDDELCFVLFGMNDGILPDFDSAISLVRKNRKSSYSYFDDLAKKGLDNIASDLKLAELFADSSFGMLNKSLLSTAGRSVASYSLSPDVSREQIALFQTLVPTYVPLRRIVHTNGTSVQQENWIRDKMLGSVANENRLFFGDVTSSHFSLNSAIDRARNNPKERVSVVLKADSESSFESILQSYSSSASDATFLDIENLQIIGDIT